MTPQTFRLEEVISCHQKGADNGSEIGAVALESLILLQTNVVKTYAKGLARVGIGQIQKLAVSIVSVVIYVGEGGEVVLQLSETDIHKLPRCQTKSFGKLAQDLHEKGFSDTHIST